MLFRSWDFNLLTNADARAVQDWLNDYPRPLLRSTARRCFDAVSYTHLRVTTLDAAQPPRTEEGAVDFSQDFFGRATNLTVSGQLEGEAMATAFGKIYTFGPTFRAENSNTPRHAAEFWMIEPEIAFADLADEMDLSEAMVKSVIAYVLELSLIHI